MSNPGIGSLVLFACLAAAAPVTAQAISVTGLSNVPGLSTVPVGSSLDATTVLTSTFNRNGLQVIIIQNGRPAVVPVTTVDGTANVVPPPVPIGTSTNSRAERRGTPVLPIQTPAVRGDRPLSSMPEIQHR